jgi:plasmid stabilization system protein ParE
MGCSVVLTPQSLADLEEIVSYIARDSPDRAQKFGQTLLDKALSVGEFPERGQIVPEVGDPLLRQVLHGPYRIIYELVPDSAAVFVTRFWHGARGEPDIAGFK